MDLLRREIVQRIPFPAGSEPFMLRVSPDGAVVWVQTQGTNENWVLDTTTMAVLAVAEAGVDPEQSAFQPGGPYGLIAHLLSNALVVLDQATGARLGEIQVGTSQGNVSFTPDGRTAFASSMGGNDVLVVDMARLAIVDRIPTVQGPQGLVLLDPASPVAPRP